MKSVLFGHVVLPHRTKDDPGQSGEYRWTNAGTDVQTGKQTNMLERQRMLRAVHTSQEQCVPIGSSTKQKKMTQKQNRRRCNPQSKSITIKIAPWKSYLPFLMLLTVSSLQFGFCRQKALCRVVKLAPGGLEIRSQGRQLLGLLSQNRPQRT